IRAGADPRILHDVIGTSSGSCWSLRNAPVPGLVPDAPVNNDFAPGFMVDLMHKDLGLALSAGAELGLPLTLTALAHQLYGLASRHGYGRLDTSAVAKLLEGAGDHPPARPWGVHVARNGAQPDAAAAAGEPAAARPRR